MRYALKLHPNSVCAPVAAIEVHLLRDAAKLTLRYAIEGRLSDLRIPHSTPQVPTSNRADELWLHTCCEAFIGAQDADTYYEFNFSPSHAWAAYRFSAYRSDMVVASEIGAPVIAVHQTGERLELQAVIDLVQLSALSLSANLRVGLAAVVEASDGSKSYWALRHPSGKPDFHHASCFDIALAAVNNLSSTLL